MTYADLIELYFDRDAALQWYWTLYVVVIGGMLAFSSMRKERDRTTTALITILFCLFAYKNHDAIDDTLRQRTAIQDSIQELVVATPDAQISKIDSRLKPTLLPPDYDGVRKFHPFIALMSVIALWAMELRRKRVALAAEKKEAERTAALS